ncbi:hypothetical protein YC2023_041255 [Brassica napus]
MAAGVLSLVGNNRVKHGLMQRSFWELYPSDSASISFLEQLKNYAADRRNITNDKISARKSLYFLEIE